MGVHSTERAHIQPRRAGNLRLWYHILVLLWSSRCRPGRLAARPRRGAPQVLYFAALAAVPPAVRAAVPAARAAALAAAPAAAPAVAPAVAPATARAAAPAAATPAAAAPDAAERHEATLLMSNVLRGGDVPKLIDEVVFVFDEISGYSVSWSLQVLSAYRHTSHTASNASRALCAGVRR